MDIHICASAFRQSFVVFCSDCLCANEIAGSRPNKRFPGTYSGSVVSPLSASPVLWAALTKVCLFDHKVFRACVLHEVNPGASPFLCFVPSYSFFLVCFFTAAPRCNSREEGGGCLWGRGCNCTPSDGVSGLGSLGSGEGEGCRRRESERQM